MESSKSNFNKYNSDKGRFDRKVDQIFQVGRQLVDGVSGTRPGTRKRTSLRDFSRRNVKNVGNWVNDKMDSFFEDDYEDWDKDNMNEINGEFKTFSRIDTPNKVKNKLLIPQKKPLEAISLRLSENNLNQQKRLKSSQNSEDESWEEDSFFQSNKWHRHSEKIEEFNSSKHFEERRNSKVRNLPRSRRSRK